MCAYCHLFCEPQRASLGARSRLASGASLWSGGLGNCPMIVGFQRGTNHNNLSTKIQTLKSPKLHSRNSMITMPFFILARYSMGWLFATAKPAWAAPVNQASDLDKMTMPPKTRHGIASHSGVEPLLRAKKATPIKAKIRFRKRRIMIGSQMPNVWRKGRALARPAWWMG